jgi:hypothetical protein
MAAPFHLTLTQNYSYPGAIAAIAGGTGTWTGDYWFTVAAVYGDQENLYSMGVHHGTASLNTHPSSDEITVGWTVPDPLPRYYRIFYLAQSGAIDWDADDWEMQDLIVSPYATSAVLSAPDPTGTTWVLGSAAPSVVLNPILGWTGNERQNMVVTANGKHRQKSWAKPTLHTDFEIELSQTSCSHTSYKILQKWARYAAFLKLSEPSSGDYSGTGKTPLYDYITGTIIRIPEIYSYGKVNAPNWELGFAVENEVYR